MILNENFTKRYTNMRMHPSPQLPSSCSGGHSCDDCFLQTHLGKSLSVPEFWKMHTNYQFPAFYINILRGDLPWLL